MRWGVQGGDGVELVVDGGVGGEVLSGLAFWRIDIVEVNSTSGPVYSGLHFKKSRMELLRI